MDRYVAENKNNAYQQPNWQVWDTVEYRAVCGKIDLSENKAYDLAREFNQAYEAGRCSKR